MDLKKKKILVVGLGKSGLSAARWLAAVGAEVTVSELRSRQELDAGVLRELEQSGIKLKAGGHRETDFIKADLIVPSPGVPYDLVPMQRARAKGIAIRGDLELALEEMQIPVLAVTGTNGKSTVTAFLGELLANAGLKTFVGGNIGTPVFEYLIGNLQADYAVIEISSFQLDLMAAFSPLVAVILNITPDHLDRYADMEAYSNSKLSIAAHQGPGQYLILNDEDERLRKFDPGRGIHVRRYGLSRQPGRAAYLEGEQLVLSLAGGSHIFDLDRYKLPGKHNRENLMACALAGAAIGLKADVIQHTLEHFRGLAHRLALAGTVRGVDFYNDSKATNIDAAIRAIQSFEKNIILIAGGRHKGALYTPLLEASIGRVRAAVFLGEAKDLLAEAFQDRLPFKMARDMREAVQQAHALARAGDVVLLAPACSSFDMFKDYAERGRIYTEIVKEFARGS